MTPTQEQINEGMDAALATMPAAERQALYDKAQMGIKVGIGLTLHVHLDDGTTKDIACVGHITEVQKENQQ